MEASSKRSRFALEIRRDRCEGKAACVAVCPNDVFSVERMSDSDFQELPFLARFKSRVHGRRTAYAVREVDCAGCAECVKACPEQAITLLRARAAPSDPSRS